MAPEAVGRLLSDQRVRYLAAGVWNSAFGWLAFVAAWWLMGEWAHLWLVIAAAHLAATTQAFIVQRRYVFTDAAGHWLTQFGRFQLAYLMMLGVGGLVVTALSAQGLHPVYAQLLGMVLLAVCGFIIGRSFTFSPAQLSFGAARARLAAMAGQHREAIVAFALAMAACAATLALHAGRTDDVPDAQRLGYLAAGAQWLDRNGWVAAWANPPWVTPAGGPLHIDLSSAFYSPLQLFAWGLGAQRASQLDLALFAVVAFWSGYALARRAFGTGVRAAAALGMAGTLVACMAWRPDFLLPLHEAAALALLTVLAVATQPGSRFWLAAAYLAACLTAWLQFGLVGLMPVAALAMVSGTVAAIRQGASILRLSLDLMVGSLLALAINGSQLYEHVNLAQLGTRPAGMVPVLLGLLSQAVIWLVLVGLAIRLWSAFLQLFKRRSD